MWELASTTWASCFHQCIWDVGVRSFWSYYWVSDVSSMSICWRLFRCLKHQRVTHGCSWIVRSCYLTTSWHLSLLEFSKNRILILCVLLVKGPVAILSALEVCICKWIFRGWSLSGSSQLLLWHEVGSILIWRTLVAVCSITYTARNLH